MMQTRADFGGYFILFLNRVKKDTKPGTIKKRIKILEELIPGRVLVLMKKKEYCLRLPGLPRMIFMEAGERDKIFLPIVCLHWMQIQENGSGIFKRCITMYGTGICLPHRSWSPFKKRGRKLKPWRNQQNQVLSFCLNA